MTHTKIKRKIATIVEVGAKKLTSGVPEKPFLIDIKCLFKYLKILKIKKNKHLRPGFIGFYWVGFLGRFFDANPE